MYQTNNVRDVKCIINIKNNTFFIFYDHFFNITDHTAFKWTNLDYMHNNIDLRMLQV